MKNPLIIFGLGFLASTFVFLMVLSMIEIPEYIIEVECKTGTIT